MYIHLLWWRYLRTRRLAFVCIGSVTLGIATLIVVNSVMGGFSAKLKQRLHGMESDIIIESVDEMGGMPIPAEEMMRRIKSSAAGPHIAAMAPSIEVFAIMQYKYMGSGYARKVKLIGIDPKLQKEVGGFAEHLLLAANKDNPSFEVSQELKRRYELNHPPLRNLPPFLPPPLPAGANKPLELPQVPGASNADGDQTRPKVAQMDPPPSEPQKFRGIIVGNALASFRYEPPNGGKPYEKYYLDRGDSVRIFTVGAEELEPVFDDFLIVDYFKSEMSEYDSSLVFVPLDHLQRLRTMEGRITTLQIRLHHYDTPHAKAVCDSLRNLFPPQAGFVVSTWEDKQGVILSAIAIERGLLNVLLFMIIGVAGFGILAIFSMIVTEKTRDIGILKSLGASNWGVRKIFIGYGLLLGIVGAMIGTGLGLWITVKINWIEQHLSDYTGQELFNRKVYYFDKIPTDIQPTNILLINLGAILIAILFSILPAIKASWIQPVRALRFE
jgi:lipoprotein-releasing system permease protein